jgi:hypothetical protein
LKKNKEKEIFIQIEMSFQQSARSKRNFAESSQNFAELSQNFTKSFENISLFEETRDKIFEVILQKLRNRHSKTFTNHRESSHFIISFSSSEVEMTKQQQQNRFDQNIQKMIQAMIREMMSEIIQQSVTAVVNMIATAARSNLSSASDHSQMTSKATSESRAKR